MVEFMDQPGGLENTAGEKVCDLNVNHTVTGLIH